MFWRGSRAKLSRAGTLGFDVSDDVLRQVHLPSADSGSHSSMLIQNWR